ncbi:Putative rRNA methylase [Sediminibacillus halophilus]|uniref:Putative rRNA methylase n=1 Tax=Sediminibacillus halophilus TaxID=482461 RepID=A0A1G9QMH1_9BACI|nr:class I SAM-dependent methyltransferase [Sediminibacillus halophilus]SDM12173.1 Putative rRNA methylase [Sediminibacillus halophilus]
MLKKVIPYAHELLRETIQPGEVAVDATCGNGHDTTVLSKLVGDDGIVYAFDIQQQAIDRTMLLLEEQGIDNVHLLLADHQYAQAYIPKADHGRIGGAIFNLGYLPGSDKQTITTPESTVEAIRAISAILKPGGLIVIVVYHGHHGGEQEKQELLDYLTSLDQKEFSVLQYAFINQQNNPPFLLALQKSV